MGVSASAVPLYSSASHGRFGGQSDQLDLQLGPRVSSYSKDFARDLLVHLPCECRGKQLQASLVLSREAPKM